MEDFEAQNWLELWFMKELPKLYHWMWLRIWPPSEVGKKAEAGKGTVQSRGEGNLSLRRVQPVMVTAALLLVRKPWKLPTLPIDKGNITDCNSLTFPKKSLHYFFFHEDSIEVPQKIKNWTIIFSFLKIFSNPTPGYLSEESKDTNSKRYCISVVSAALFAIAMIQKQPTCPSMEARTKKMWYTHTYTHNV